MKWFREKRRPERPYTERPVLIHALDGFLGAGSASRLAAQALSSGEGQVLHSFDVDEFYDYRARRPLMAFKADHYAEYDEPRLDVVLEHDVNGHPYLLLAGPEPDFHWEAFIEELADVVDRWDVSLTLGLGAVPMGVPHTRPLVLTSHGTKPSLVDRKNLWQGTVNVPSSAASLLELRFGERGLDAAGYVVHVPHYLAQIEYPTAAIALLDALEARTGLTVDLDDLRRQQSETLVEIQKQIDEQDGGALLSGLEQQYDAFTRGAADSLLAHDEELPTGEELADQFEQFLAKIRKEDQE
ncbi:PAC2 family protein [Aeromicrobium massiliense]|uniref:PAC2 family protein n=1 Tax=Aeromicrobium massiliense TaxID=1464554 RepID=UPI00031F42DD|nr:PAC2 family protein [Aeromicrobium massiliense]